MRPNSDSLIKFFDVDPLEVRLWKETVNTLQVRENWMIQ